MQNHTSHIKEPQFRLPLATGFDVKFSFSLKNCNSLQVFDLSHMCIAYISKTLRKTNN